MGFAIIADSCADLTPELKESYGITTVPLTMRLGDKEFLDDDTLDLPGFMAQMAGCTEKVGSASPPPSTYQDAFEKAGTAFAVTLSRKLSGSYDSAMMGKQFAEEMGAADVHVFDSKSGCAGETLVTVKIGELVRQNLSKEAIIEHANHFIDNMKTYFVLENYDNLQKNGRMSKVTCKLISILGMRLVMGTDGDGSIVLCHKARGENAMLEKMVDLVDESGKQTEG